MNSKEGEYREYPVRHIDAKGHETVTTLREWLNPKTNKQRQDNARVKRWKARFEPMYAGLTPSQRRNRKRRLSKAFKIREIKKGRAEKK
jgi:hypothetical protein